MAQENLDLGTTPNDGLGDGLRDAMSKVENNFTELYTNYAENTTTTALSESDLDTAYPSVITGFKVYCEDITPTALIYEKTPSGWVSYEITTVS